MAAYALAHRNEQHTLPHLDVLNTSNELSEQLSIGASAPYTDVPELPSGNHRTGDQDLPSWIPRTPVWRLVLVNYLGTDTP
jgi:hypothetical protein